MFQSEKDDPRSSKKDLSNSLLKPRKMIALVDPNASWLLSWLHGHLGRTLFFELLDGSKHLSANDAQVPRYKNNFVR